MAFGDGTAQARVAARYANFSAEEMHRAQIARNRSLNEPATLADIAGPHTVTPLRKASDKAIDYLVALNAERTPHVTAEEAARWARSVDAREVSAKIDWLKTLPKVVNSGIGSASSKVPAGRYAVTGDRGQTVFVKVDIADKGPFKGRVFLRIQAGDELIRVSATTRNALLLKVENDGIEQASRRYGRELGSCGVCGRTLTDEASRAEGIGPVCRGKMGW